MSAEVTLIFSSCELFKVCSHLPQEIILAHHIPIPDLHSDVSINIISTFIQTQLKMFIPVREACFLDDLTQTQTHNKEDISVDIRL